MATIIYTLCALTSLACAVLLLRGYARSKVHLLLWSGLCFVGLFANNTLLVLDLVVFPKVDLFVPRLCAALAGFLLLLFGLIWEKD